MQQDAVLRTLPQPAPARPRASRAADVLRLVLSSGGPAFCQFALNNTCNANCGFCNFARDSLAKENWEFVPLAGALEAISILQRNGVRYLVLTGGEPTLHPDVTTIIERASRLGMKVMLVTNGGLLKRHKIEEWVAAGVSSFIISIDAASREAHEANRGLPGVCERIIAANAIFAELGVHATASVTMSRLVDYEVLPDFLRSLGFSSVTFSYPLTRLSSSFLGYSDSDLVDYSSEELLAAFESIKRLKKRFLVVNPLPSIEDMQRFLRDEPQRFECLGGFRYFYLDWSLMLWRCHNWHEPMCSVFDFDETKLIRDGCTRCMIDCYRDSSVMQHIAVSVHDAWQATRRGHVGAAGRALARSSNLGSIRAVLQELPWLLRF